MDNILAGQAIVYIKLLFDLISFKPQLSGTHNDATERIKSSKVDTNTFRDHLLWQNVDDGERWWSS